MNSRDRLIAREVVDKLTSLDRRVSTLARKPQLHRASIENGSLNEYNSKGDLAATFGRQYDGSHAAVSYTGPPPPRPTAPIPSKALGGAAFRWNGAFVDSYGVLDITIVPTLDWSRVELHVSADPNLTADSADTLADTIETPRGATRAVMLEPGTYYARFVSRSLSGKRSPASDVATVEVLPLVQDPELEETLTGLQDDLDTAEQRVNTAEADIETLNTQTIPALESDLSTLDSDLATAEGRLSTVEGDVDDAVSDVSELETLTGGWTATGTTEIDGGAVTADSLTALQIAGKTITAAEIKAASLTSASGVFGIVDASVINAGTIAADRLNAEDIRSKFISAGKITAADIVAGSLTSASGIFGIVDASVINAGTVHADRIGARSITAAKIAADSITANEIHAGAISTTELASNAITASKIAAGAITANKLTIGSIDADGNVIGERVTGSVANADDATNAVSAGSADDVTGRVRPGTAIEADVPADKLTGQIAAAIEGNLYSTGYVPSSSPGWYRIAELDSARASGHFILRDTNSGRHSTVTFDAGIMFGNNPYVNLSAFTSYSSTPTFEQIRLSWGGTYDPAYIDVFVSDDDTHQDVTFYITENIQQPGWTPVAWEAAPSLPSGFQSIVRAIAYSEVTTEKARDAKGRVDNWSYSGTTEINGGRIRTGTVKADQIDADAVTASKIRSGAITADKLTANAIDGKTITGATITASSGGIDVTLGPAVYGDTAGLKFGGGFSAYLVSDGDRLSMASSGFESNGEVQVRPNGTDILGGTVHITNAYDREATLRFNFESVWSGNPSQSIGWANGWGDYSSSYNPVTVRKIAPGMAVMTGMLRIGTAVEDVHIGTLYSSDLQPSNKQYLPCVINSGDYYGAVITIEPNGVMRYRGLPFGENSDYVGYVVVSITYPTYY